jgi:hypothetical protein
MRNSKGQFQLGHSGGRPKGARNRLAAQVYEDILHHWCEPAAHSLLPELLSQVVYVVDPILVVRQRVPASAMLGARTVKLTRIAIKVFTGLSPSKRAGSHEHSHRDGHGLAITIVVSRVGRAKN